MVKKEFSVEIGGKQLIAEFNDLADQTNGSVVIRYGNTAVLATAVMSSGLKDGLDYFPLTVDYEERFYAAGQILGSRFMRREGRPSDEAILTGRVVDRTIRPLFNQKMRNEVQVVITVLSLGDEDPDVLSVIGASLALGTSNIPWNGPVSAVRIGKQKDTDGFVVNPTYVYREDNAELDLLACGKDGNINMIEVGARQVNEEALHQAFEQANKELETLQTFQKNVIAEIGKEKQTVAIAELHEQTRTLFHEHITPKIPDALFSGAGKEKLYALKGVWSTLLSEHAPDENKNSALDLFEEMVDAALHAGALDDNRRADGRAFDEIRPLSVQAGNVAPMLHGAGIFYRGGTHVLSALTLGGPEDSQILDGMELQTKKHFMHHYNFPPFSTGETGRISGTNRRAVGHGALAEKALSAVIPSKETFPYTIRIVSEVLASNGSSSMGSVCGSTLALMDAGVPIEAPVAGIAMGLTLDPKLSPRDAYTQKRYKILTDIQGPEDHHGDMDFKVAGTRSGVTAVQMDVKVDGVPLEILMEAFAQAKQARLQILDVIEREIATPRPQLSPLAPRILMTTIKTDCIGLVIGSGGKTVNAIKDATGADITIEDDGTVYITGEVDGAERAKQIIEAIVREYKRGDRVEGVVSRLAEFGAFVTLGEATGIQGLKPVEGLVHISEIAPFRIGDVRDVLVIGEHVQAIVRDVDEQGKISLSIKDIDPEFASRKGVTPSERPPMPPHARGPRPPHERDRGERGFHRESHGRR